jgi:hypothetical protein
MKHSWVKYGVTIDKSCVAQTALQYHDNDMYLATTLEANLIMNGLGTLFR